MLGQKTRYAANCQDIVRNVTLILNTNECLMQDNLMRKLACKTLMEILPGDEQIRVQQELTEKKLSVDFDTVVGLVVG